LKIYEKVIYKRLFDYFVENKFLVDNQFGFRKQHSTSMAILRLVDQIATEIDKGNLNMGVFIDLSKAFHTIDHHILLDKLSMYGIRGNCFTIRYDSGYLTCSKKLTGSQLSLPHGTNKKLECETKNKMMSIIGPV